MAELNFPSNPQIGDTYVIGIRTWVWNGSGWQLQSGIVSTNPFTVVTAYVTSSTNSTSTDTGALRVVGGVGIGRDVTIGGKISVAGTATVGSIITTGTIYATGIFDNNAQVVTTATIGNFGISNLSAGTDTAVSSSTGVVVVWSTATLDSIASRNSSTNQAITITNPTESWGTSSGALVVHGGIGVGGSINVLHTGTIEHIIGGDGYIRDLRINTGVVEAILTVTTTLEAFDITGGAVRIAGGVGIEKSLYVGRTVSAANLVSTSATIADLTITNTLVISSTASSTSTTTGALVIGGGLGVAENLYASAIYDNNNRVVTSVIANEGPGIGISNLVSSGTNVSFTVTNLGVQTLSAGTDTAVSASTGTVVVWSTATLQSITSRSSSTDQAISITNTTESLSTISGALTVAGGVGVIGSIYAGAIFDQNSRVITQATLGNYGVSVITAGTDTAVSTSTGPVVVWSTATLQSITNRGSTTTNRITIDNILDSNTSTQGALVVTGGAAVGRNLVVGGSAAVYGNLQVYGSTTYVNSTQTYITDAILELGGGLDGTQLEVNDGIDRGLVFHYSTTATANTSYANNAFFGMDNPTQTLLYKTNIYPGIPFGNVTSFANIGDWGAARFGKLTLENTTNASSTNSGALVVAGGIGAGGGLNMGGSLSMGEYINMAGPAPFINMLANGPTLTHSINFKDTNLVTRFSLESTSSVASMSIDGVRRLSISSSTVEILTNTTASSTQTGALQVFGGAGIRGDLYAMNIYANGSKVITEGSLSSVGVTAITAGTDTAISTSTGLVTVWNTSTLQSITQRGSSTNQVVTFNAGVDSTGTAYGTVVVQGGVGVSGKIYANEIYDSNSRVLTINSSPLYVVTELQSGSDISLNTSRGIIVISSTGTLQSVTNRGAVTNNAITITNTLAVTGDVTFSGKQTWIGSTGSLELSLSSSTWSLLPSTGQYLQLGSGTTFIGVNTSTPTVALDVFGDIKGFNIYANGAQVLTTSTIGNYGVSKITTGSGIVVTPSSGVGIVNIETTDTLQAVTDRGAVSSNAITITSFVTATSTSTGALKVIGGVGIAGDMYVGKTATIMNLVAGPIQGTSTLAVSGLATFTSIQNSAGTTSGAVVVSGGVGVVGNLYAGAIYDRTQRVVTTVVPTAGNAGIAITSLISTGTTASFVISNSGVLSLTAGTDTVITSSTGAISIWNNSTLQTITNRGATTNNVVTFNNGLDTSTSTQGTVVVAGGIGVSKNLIVGGNAAVYGNLQVFGTQTFVNSTQTYIIDPVIELGGGVGNTSLSTNDGFDRGLVLHYSTTATANTSYDNHAFIGMENASQTFVYKTNVYPGGTQTYTPTFANTGTFGQAKFGRLTLVGGTTATSTGTGDLVVWGGVGIWGSLYAGNMYSNGLQVLTTASLGSGGVGVSTINAGTDTAVSGNFGAITIWGTSTLQSVTSRGNTTTSPITINNGTNASSTTTGALIISGGGGGIGVGGAVIASQLRAVNSANTSSSRYDINAVNGNTNISIIANAGGGNYNPIVQSGDSLVYWTQGGQGSGSLVLAPWSSTATGIRISNLGVVSLPSLVDATSSSTGALIVSGGASITKNLFVGNNTTITNALDVLSSLNATSTATGAFQVEGGAGIGGDVWIGGPTIAVGPGATTRSIVGTKVYSNGRFSTDGDAQAGTYVMRVSSVSNLYAALTTNNGVAGLTNQLLLPNNATYSFKIMVNAKSTTSTDEGAWEFNGIVSRYATASTTILRVLNKTKIWSSIAAWDVNVSADTVNGLLSITAKGDGANTVRFVARVDTVEVTN
jgi:hypothetical protein